MTLRFLKLEWKQFFRSASFGKGIAIKIIMGFLALYFIVSFLAVGVGGYYLLKKEFPETDPLQLVNSYLLYAVLGDLIFRYLMQKLPIINIKPLLILPIKRSKLVHYVLTKSSFSFFNILGLFFYIPFAIVLIKEGCNVAGVLGWLFAVILMIQSVNFLNFLINKNNIALGAIVVILVSLIGLQKLGIYDVTAFGGQVFDAVYANPMFSLIGVAILAILYNLNYKQLRSLVYLDEAVSQKVEEATSADLSFADKLGDVAPFIKNDMRLIWRNKRTKTVFLMSFLFLFYGLVFFTQKSLSEVPAMLMFASLFITGGFALNYGQFIPAWDSAHYKMLMSQSFKYRKFLESKWILMVVMTSFLYLLSFPYLYFGLDIFLMITAGAIFNIGFNSLFLLYAGSFNRKRIDLNKSGFGNTQGTSATQFLIIIPLMLLPMLLFWVFDKFVGGNSGYIVVAAIGVIGLLCKKYALNFIERKYIENKYVMINAFGKEA
ncbi:hypothetical protein CW731_11175 [Polaribacter sp. ALD11]|uniref:DUF5687 family protein n=1 Tax=Polaribacter sp. ALD11 TaxID=2058137 RepID=UPI000C3183A9|nr:DUF5687 family protein [Polaribacter sp. ALD11]AUC85813.1 hypothetical protein CW731_11175 [Polaribacter sp. ALD11]